jgi:hypothetical protein
VKLGEHAARSEARHRPAALRARHDPAALKSEQGADAFKQTTKDATGAKQAAEPKAFGEAPAYRLLAGAGEAAGEVLVATAERTGA